MGRRLILGVATLLACVLGAAGGASAQTCSRVGQEICQNGQTYRCEQAGSELGLVFQNRPCTVNVPSLTGTWRGTGHQTPAGTAGADWSIEMTIGASGGSIQYPSLSCGGSLAQISRDATSAQYRESITVGRNACIDGGTITVRLVNGNLAWTWIGQSNGKQYNAIAVLTR
jgi:hypothetical protein